MRIVLLGLAVAALSACSNWGFPGVYRINVEQGNIVTEEMVDQLKPGMTRQQVRYILGTPLVEDTFDRDRWDYIYLLRNGTDTLQDYRLTVYFEGEELLSFDTTIDLGSAPVEHGGPDEDGNDDEEEEESEET